MKIYTSRVELADQIKLCTCLQEWPRSPGLHVLQTGGQAESAADYGTGTPHPQGSHIQGKRKRDTMYVQRVRYVNDWN